MAGSGEVKATDLPDQMQEATELPVQIGARVSLAELEAEHIRRVLASSRSQEEAAHVLGIDPTTLYRKRRKMETVDATADAFKAD